MKNWDIVFVLSKVILISLGLFIYFLELSLDLVGEWLAKNAIFGGELSIGGIANYQPFDGLMELKVVIFIY